MWCGGEEILHRNRLGALSHPNVADSPINLFNATRPETGRTTHQPGSLGTDITDIVDITNITRFKQRMQNLGPRLESFKNELGDPVTHIDFEWRIAVIDQNNTDDANVVRIDHASHDVDTVLRCQTGSRRDTAIRSFWARKSKSRRYEFAFTNAHDNVIDRANIVTCREFARFTRDARVLINENDRHCKNMLFFTLVRIGPFRGNQCNQKCVGRVVSLRFDIFPYSLAA
jgi:hypothetical protein